MSRIGKKPVVIPSGVEVKLDGNTITVKGPKGTLTRELAPSMKITSDGKQITVEEPDQSRESESLHGLTRSLIQNMVEGVNKGYSKELNLVGVGYRAKLTGKDLEMTLGFSHPVVVKAPEGITFQCPKNDVIIVSGPDKQVVGQTAAEIRGWRKPEPYKGKGIRYKDEHVRRKLGKAAKSGE